MANTLHNFRNALIGLPIYRPLRYIHQSLFDKAAITRREHRKEFYASFVRPGDVVFDVGANLGHYAEAFQAIGATVVAIEPDPRNVKMLRKRLKGERFNIVPCALGSSEGTAELQIASDRDDVSTLSREWSAITEAQWEGTVQVQVRTLDSIAREYGVPKYIKVDAEGYDAEVLRGMSFKPQMVSFEFLPRDMKIARECIGLLQGFSFNFVIEERSRFELQEWVGGEAIVDAISRLDSSVLYGDIFARSSRA